MIVSIKFRWHLEENSTYYRLNLDDTSRRIPPSSTLSSALADDHHINKRRESVPAPLASFLNTPFCQTELSPFRPSPVALCQRSRRRSLFSPWKWGMKRERGEEEEEEELMNCRRKTLFLLPRRLLFRGFFSSCPANISPYSLPFFWRRKETRGGLLFLPSRLERGKPTKVGRTFFYAQ